MSLDTLEQVFRWVFSSGLVREPFTLLWHAGEPLVVPVAWYEAAAALLQRYGDGQPPVTQSVPDQCDPDRRGVVRLLSPT